jgi:hypothetical protein
MIRLLSYPVIFGAGWLFNFVVDVRFMAGFASGWLAHTWLGPILNALFQ